jgi:SAM-dependent methyltransferase
MSFEIGEYYYTRSGDRNSRVVDTTDNEYTESLVTKQRAWWKRLLPVQAPYAWNLRRMRLGLVLEVGCGIGRNLHHLKGSAVGIDHNEHSVRIARSMGLEAYTPDEFAASPRRATGAFDALLLSHLVEHMSEEEAVSLVAGYLDLVRPGGRVVFITPQEVGYRSDPTHVTFVDFEALERIGDALGLETVRAYSFPFPRAAGRLFIYNEFVVIMRRPSL